MGNLKDKFTFLQGGVFLGSTDNYVDSWICILGLPLDVTSTFRPGSRFAPQSIRSVSEVLEEFSPFLKRDLKEVAFCDLGDLELVPGRIRENLTRIEEVASEVWKDGKLLLSLGGEHLVSYPLIRAARSHYPELAVLHFDAHADLREEYQGEKYSHATVMRLVAEEIGPSHLYQLGIRSCTWEEWVYGSENTNLFLDHIELPLSRLLPELKGRPLYLTLDIDVVDPAYAPGTGTPEPGGCRPQDIFSALYLLKDAHIIGLDIVEVSPAYDMGNITSILAAKLVREAILAFGPSYQNKMHPY
ncbi:agmatinase [Thermanaeromonas toyohensis ToBE]|uniref:Agmatinase n=1 Tax=Thermanaeromonas toyohensis ToBE TaxID=698762 RepID=A0A1W1W0G6_9FIRM|nr:agmatinase [Thermanaeromonas toyohensis]SMB99088.1 agmatinase [Thermanaeromonas toyohensis ToBE]